MTFDDHTFEGSVKSERVNGSERTERPLNSRRARGCTRGSAAKYISHCITVSIACVDILAVVRVHARACPWGNRETQRIGEDAHSAVTGK